MKKKIELFLTESRKKGIPLGIGSAGDTVSNRGVDEVVAIIKELGFEDQIAKFKIGYFYSEVSKDFLKQKIRNGKELTGLGGFPQLTEGEIDEAIFFFSGGRHTRFDCDWSSDVCSSD